MSDIQPQHILEQKQVEIAIAGAKEELANDICIKKLEAKIAYQEKLIANRREIINGYRQRIRNRTAYIHDQVVIAYTKKIHREFSKRSREQLKMRTK